MTKAELSQIRFLRKEIEHYEQELNMLKSEADSCVRTIDGLPHSKRGGSRVESYALRINDLKKIILLRHAEYERLEKFIEQAGDSEMRMILSLKYIRNLSFQQIAFEIGYQDESVPRKRMERFLKMTELSEKRMLL
ncbi:MAG: hypothetical protein Q8878_06185 [Bacillota bacterium]|nr:hypothetical protein [Bacillota bacterium]